MHLTPLADHCFWGSYTCLELIRVQLSHRLICHVKTETKFIGLSLYQPKLLLLLYNLDSIIFVYYIKRLSRWIIIWVFNHFNLISCLCFSMSKFMNKGKIIQIFSYQLATENRRRLNFKTIKTECIVLPALHSYSFVFCLSLSAVCVTVAVSLVVILRMWKARKRRLFAVRSAQLRHQSELSSLTTIVNSPHN